MLGFKLFPQSQSHLKETKLKWRLQVSSSLPEYLLPPPQGHMARAHKTNMRVFIHITQVGVEVLGGVGVNVHMAARAVQGSTKRPLIIA